MKTQTAETLPVDLKLITEKVESIRVSLNPIRFNGLQKDELESRTFFSAFPICSTTFSEFLEFVVSTLKLNLKQTEASDFITCILKACTDVLQIINDALVEVNKIGLKELEYVCSAPKNIACILLKAFQHCQTSETVYGDKFSFMSELLTLLFRKAYEVQSNLFVFLNKTVVFNCALQNELDLLVEVMDLLSQIGEVLIGLDIKTLATQWKGYMQLTDSHIQHLKVWLDVSRPIRFLADHIRTTLQKVSFAVNSDTEECGKQLMKDLKLGNFLLKIVVKLCELYNDHLGECHHQLLYLLVNLYGFSSCYLHNYNLPNGVVDYIERNITIAAGPLLSQLYQDNSFITEFIKLADNYNSVTCDEAQPHFIKAGEKIGFILMTVSIMKKISNSEYSVQQCWKKIDKTLVHIILDALSVSGVEMNLDIVINRIEIPGVSDLYEHIFTHTAAFIIGTHTETSFAETEKLLVTKVLQPEFWTALLASDLFCLLARFGNNELRLSQAHYFTKLIAEWPKSDRKRPEWIYSVRLANRLLKMIPVEEAQSLLHQRQELLSIDINLIGILSDDCDLETVYDSVEKFVNSESNNKLPSFHYMVDSLNKIAYSNVADEMNLKFNLLLAKLWNCCADVAVKTKCDSWMNNLIKTLSFVSGVLMPKMESEMLNEVISALLSIVQHCSVSSKIIILKFLKVLASKEIKSVRKQTEIFKRIAQLFGKLINDPNVFVNLMALDTFKYFAAITKHVQIIAFTAQTDPNVEQSLKAYLQCNIFPAKENVTPMEFENYLEQLNSVKFMHKFQKPKTSVDQFLLTTSGDKHEGSISCELKTENTSTERINVEDENNCQEKNANGVLKKRVDEDIFNALEELNTVVSEFVSNHCSNSPNCVELKDEDKLCVLLNELENCIAKCRNIK